MSGHGQAKAEHASAATAPSAALLRASASYATIAARSIAFYSL